MQHGTGDAVSVGLTSFPEDDLDDSDVLVLPGDTPLLRPETIAELVREHRLSEAACTVLTAIIDDPTGYGRVVRGKDGRVARIVEEADAERRRACDPRDQHLDLLLPPQRARTRAAPGRALRTRRASTT